MKTLKTLVMAVLMVSALPSCESIKTAALKVTPAQVTTLSHEAAVLGTKAVVKKNDQKLIAQITTTHQALVDLVASKAVTGAVLRSIVATLPFKQLDNDNARLAVTGVTMLYDSTIGTGLNIEEQPYVLAAATGLRDGIGEGLGLEKPAN